MNTFYLIFITPLFSRGAYADRPEIRAPSIRGQLHWWFRALGGTYRQESGIFGSVHAAAGGAKASRIVVRVSAVQGDAGLYPTLPHKSGGQASPKMAFRPGTTCRLDLIERLGGIPAAEQALWNRTLKAWLLLGSLGLRSTRGAGSFRWKSGDPSWEYPASLQSYQEECRQVLGQAPLRARLLSKGFQAAEDARHLVSDTLGGRDDHAGQSALSMLNHPLGKAFQGRKTSPLKFRVVQVGQEFFIAAIWDARDAITGNSTAPDLPGIIRLLRDKKPELGNLLQPLLD